MGAPKRVPFNIFLDSDGVVADFDKKMVQSGLSVYDFKHRAGSYLYLDEMPGAAEAIEILKGYDNMDMLRVWIATKTPDFAPYAYTEKVLWFREHFPWLENRVIVVHDKSQLGGHDDVLVDDRPHKGNANLFRGTFFHFGSPEFPTWPDVTSEILKLMVVVTNANARTVN